MSSQYTSQQPLGFKNYIEHVAVVGAGGEQGGYITDALLAQGKHKVTAITRPDSTSKLPESLHAVKKADYNDRDALVAALQGQDVLIITLNVMAPKDSQTKLIDAAVKAGVKYIMPNEWGGDYSNPNLAGTFTGSTAVTIREYIEKVGQGRTHWIALTCSFWYQFSLAGLEYRYGFDFAAKTATFFDEGDTKICTTTWPQTGRAVAALLALPIFPSSPSDTTITLIRWHNRPVYIASFVLSQRDMLAAICRVTGASQSSWSITHEPTGARMQRGNDLVRGGDWRGLPTMLYSRIFFPSGEGDFSEKLDNAVLGLPEEDLDEETRVAVQWAEEGVIAKRDAGNGP